MHFPSLWFKKYKKVPKFRKYKNFKAPMSTKYKNLESTKYKKVPYEQTLLRIAKVKNLNEFRSLKTSNNLISHCKMY